MPFATERDKIGVIQQGLASTFWTDYLLPLLMERAKNNLTALAMSRAEDDDIKRGRFQAYQDVINSPGREVEAFNLSEQEAQAKNDEEARDDYRAQMGFRSPIRDVEVGDLKQEESATEAN